MSEAAWNRAFTQGSRALQDRLKKVHASNPKFQAWMQKSGHGAGASVKQASKEVKPSARVKSLQTKSLQAYGATKGTKVGGEHGSGEMRDTIAPLTRDQHSKVQAAERAAKAAAKKAAPAKPKKPLSQAERMAAIAKAVTKAKSKDRFDVPTVNPDDVDHDDLRDVHNQMHIRGTYSEATDRMALIKTVASKNKMNQPPKLTKKPDTVKRMIDRHKYFSHIDNVTGYTTTSKKKGMNRFEEVEQIDELKWSTLQSYLDKRPAPKIKDVARPETVGKPEERQKDIERANLTRIGRARAKAKLLKRNPQPRTAPEYDPNDRGYGQGRYMGDSIELEGQTMNEVSQKEAEKMLGGPVKTKPSNAPAGKLPYGFRRARNLARKAMKTGKPVTESTTEVLEVNEMNHGKKLAKMIMAKQSQHPIAQNMGEENIVEQDDSMEKKEMAQTQLHFIGYAAKEILEFIDMGGEIEEWYQNKLSKVQSEVESLHSYIEGEKRRTGMVKEEEQIDEKAPPGAKYERMVKHIKKGYAKGGLTPQEKSIAYATAWKAYGKKNEEVEATEETLDEKYMGFKAVMAAAKKGGARDPAAVAAAIGRKKYGKEKFQAMAAAGKKANEEVKQIDEQSPAEIKAKYYHDQFDKVKPVKAYDKEGKLVGRYRSMDHAKQMKPGHTYKVEEGVVTEAEGTVAVTPKEKALAAHHGDPKKITYGDVIKARLKSAAAKKMGNK